MDISKIIAKLPTGFVDDAAAMDTAQLERTVIEAEENIRETEREKKADTKLQGAKEIVKDLSSGYNDAIKAQRAKIAYALHLRDERCAPRGGTLE